MTREPNKIERMTMVKCMEFIARNLNDEEIFMAWLSDGVADGDIKYGDVYVNPLDRSENDLDYYTEDENFADIMDTFIHVMKAAAKSGGLYCDGIRSKASE